MAKRFQFRLATLLKIREAKKKEAQRILGEHMAELLRLQDHHKWLAEQKNQAADSRRAGKGEAVSVETWRSVERFLLSMDRKMAENAEKITRAQILVENARKELTKAHQAHLTLQRLKERRQEQYNYEVSLDEQKQADELAIMRYQFKSSTVS
ncbi:MAG: flagellar export protein FliJ [Holophagales bacterium]|jgi:flagellar FliJ protein|nr:flagellar export protein FliJ [Holophagales bacterium]